VKSFKEKPVKYGGTKGTYLTLLIKATSRQKYDYQTLYV